MVARFLFLLIDIFQIVDFLLNSYSFYFFDFFHLVFVRFCFLSLVGGVVGLDGVALGYINGLARGASSLRMR